MDAHEQRLFSDVVKLVNRTAYPLDFLYDAVVYTVPARGQVFLPRHIARYAAGRQPVKVAPTGRVRVSLLGIEGETDCQPFSDEMNPTDLQETQKLDIPPAVVNGRPVTMKPLALAPEPTES